MRRIIRCHWQFEFFSTFTYQCHRQLLRHLERGYVGSSDPEASSPTRETGSLVNHPMLSPTWSSRRRINRVLWLDSPTLGYSDYPSQLLFSVFLLHLSNSSQRSFGQCNSLLFHCVLISLRWIGRLNSMVHWMSRFNGALDISSRRYIGRLVSTVYWTSRLEYGLDSI